MARFEEPTAKELKSWAKWKAARPEIVRRLADRFEPWSLFRMKGTGQRVVVVGFYEDGTLRVIVSGRFNRVPFDCGVFGVDPENLEPCDLPGPHEELGAILTDEDDIREYVDAVRPYMLDDTKVH